MVTGGSYSAKGHPYFVLSELSVYDLGEPVFTPDDGFPFLTPQEMQTLFDDIVNAKLDLAYSSTSEQVLTERINQVEGAMNVIKESVSSKRVFLIIFQLYFNSS